MSQVHAFNQGDRLQAWTTPRPVFLQADAEFHFDLDAAASADNALCARFFSIEDDALAQVWTGRVWCNPPYNRCDAFVRHAAAQVERGHAEVVVMLVPVRADVGWWHDVALKPNCEIRWIRGRLRFGECRITAPFASCLLVLRRPSGRTNAPEGAGEV